jgi:hypothetical protein
VVIVQADALLLHIVLAFGAIGGIADFLNCRQQQRDQNADDRDYHQQLNQGEGRPPSCSNHVFLLKKK